jgi:signal transduction histidine kinase
MTTPLKILLIEDDEDDRVLMRDMLEELRPRLGGIDLVMAPTVPEAEARLHRDSFDLVLSDLSLPESRGVETVRRVIRAAPDVPVVVLTGLQDETTALEALRLGAQDYLVKGTIQPPLLFKTLRYAIERNRLLSEWHRATEKMVSLGQLTAGMTHEFNNLLCTIMISVEFVLENLGPDHPARKDAEAVRTAINGAASLTQPLLAFGRGQVIRPEILRINDIVEVFRHLLERVIGAGHQIGIDLQKDPWPIRADPGQIQQVILNLVLNARDAMPPGGQITLETRNVEVPLRRVQGPFTLEPGSYVRLAVNDRGPGIAPELMDKILEPFFTTKEKGKGTGLGLPMVHGIAQQNGGALWIDSDPGLGASVQLYLPRFSRST